MSSQLDVTAMTAVLKQKYTQRRFNKLSYPDNPLYAMMAKDPDFGGKNGVCAMRYGTPQGRGTNLAIAQAARTSSNFAGFVLTRSFDYVSAVITGEAILAAKGDTNTLIEGLTNEIDAATQTGVRSLAIAMYKNGGGQRGQISTVTSFLYPGTSNTITIGIAQTTIQLTNIGDIVNFEQGMQVGLSADDGTGGAGLRTGGATMVTITGVDRDNGLLTANVAWNTISGAATSDYIFQGAPGIGSDYNGMVKGLAAWVPIQPPATTDSFFGVNRSADSRLYGLRQVGTGNPIEEVLMDAAAKVGREGGKSTHFFCNPLDWASLEKSQTTRVVFTRTTAAPNNEPEIGFTALEFMGPKGPIKVISDQNCPKGTGYLLQMDTWGLWSLGDAPQLLTHDGLTIRAISNADAYEVRVGMYAQIACEAPIWNCVVQY